MEREKLADLHVHTTASDGEIRPEEAVRLAKRAKLAAVAIVDHDSVDGIEPALEAGKLYDIEVILGVELTYEEGPREAHLLGYFIDWRERRLVDELIRLQHGRLRRIWDILAKLEKMGISISYNEVLKVAGGGAVIGRPHVARALLERGYVESINEAFELYLGYGRPAHVSRYQLPLGEFMRLIRNAGGVPALAHPKFQKAEELLPNLVLLGLRGIEVYHPDHSRREVVRFQRLACKHGLIEVGGSDAHDDVEHTIGMVTVPYEVVEKLRAESGKI